MSSWNAMSYEAKDTILRVVRAEGDQFFDLVDDDAVWEAPTGAGHWQVRDLVAHIVDTTEAYFVAFDAARSGAEVDLAYGLPGMAARVDAQAQALRNEPRAALVERLRADREKMMEILEALSEDDWTNLLVSHFYMGPLPAFFYPAFQLMDYGVHSWDARQGTGRAHGLDGEAADLLTPFMFVLWKYTVAAGNAQPCELGIRITSGPNAGDTRVSVGPGGMDYQPGSVDDLSAVLEFDPGSFVLTAFGRSKCRHHSRGPHRGRPVPEPVLPDLAPGRIGGPEPPTPRLSRGWADRPRTSGRTVGRTELLAPLTVVSLRLGAVDLP